MAYKDFMGTGAQDQDDSNFNTDEAMFFSRPLVLPGGAFGALNFFFDPELIKPKEIEALGSMVADFLDQYWQDREQRQNISN